MELEAEIRRRGISQILHFTTNSGLLGIFATKSVKSRYRLPEEKYLEYVYQPNCSFRRDAAWIDYVNLSIERINGFFFDVCFSRWHSTKDIWWCILAFDPIILTHEGVYFTTTNNIYSGVLRGKGVLGFNALYKPIIHQYSNKYVKRASEKSDAEPTCDQAEVLYPRELSLDFLRKIYIRDEEHADIVAAQENIFDISTPISLNEELFK